MINFYKYKFMFIMIYISQFYKWFFTKSLLSVCICCRQLSLDFFVFNSVWPFYHLLQNHSILPSFLSVRTTRRVSRNALLCCLAFTCLDAPLRSIWFHFEESWDWGRLWIWAQCLVDDIPWLCPSSQTFIWKTTVREHLGLLYMSIMLFSLSTRTCNNYVKVCMWGKFNTFHKGMDIQSQLWTCKPGLANVPQVRKC